MKWIINNLKEKLVDEAYKEKIRKLKNEKVNIIVCPNDKQLSDFKEENYLLGSQDVDYIYPIEELKSMNVKYSIVGHSDKRKQYNETNQEINKKIKSLLVSGISPILCIGEETEEDSLKEILKIQLTEALESVHTDCIMIAYEPVWAIGSGRIPSANRLIEALEYIQEKTQELLGINPILLYGGSVNETTILSLEKLELLDGYLIGSTLDTEKLKTLIETTINKSSTFK